jgi:hypothetical protein
VSQQPERRRGMDERGEGTVEPDEGGGAHRRANTLGQEIPRRVDDRGGEDEGGGGHPDAREGTGWARPWRADLSPQALSVPGACRSGRRPVSRYRDLADGVGGAVFRGLDRATWCGVAGSLATSRSSWGEGAGGGGGCQRVLESNGTAG